MFIYKGLLCCNPDRVVRALISAGAKTTTKILKECVKYRGTRGAVTKISIIQGGRTGEDVVRMRLARQGAAADRRSGREASRVRNRNGEMHMDERPNVSSRSGSAQMRETNQRTGRRRADQESDRAVDESRGTGHSQRGCELETEAEDERDIWDAASDDCHGWCDTAERVRGVCARGVDGGAEEIARAIAGVLDGDLRTEYADAELDGREGDARRFSELLDERLGGVRLIRARGEAGDEGGGVGFALWGRWPCRLAGAEAGGPNIRDISRPTVVDVQ
ncbi:hypothetical protein FB451DRAFT_1191802 [Mycena latifolia]|nr:hypothetical protein FB451DRAFT_1191802 [Mycena latifolia]